MIFNNHVCISMQCFHVSAPWQLCSWQSKHRASYIFCFRIPVPGVLGRVQFSSNSADVTRLFWPVICDRRTATATSEQECFRGRVVTGTDPNRGSGDGGSPVSLGWLLLVGGHRQSGKWGRDRTETGRGVGMVFVCGARRARPLACCIPWDQHHGVSFHPIRRGSWPAYLLSPTAPILWLLSFFLSRDYLQCPFTTIPLLSLHTLLLLLS